MMTQKSDMGGVFERMRALEQAHRRWQAIGCLGVLFVGAVLLLGATGATVLGEVRTKKIVLVDTDGRTRGVWSSGSRGTVWLMGQAGGKAAAELLVDEDGSVALNLYDKDGNVRSSFAVTNESASLLHLLDTNHKRGVDLSVGRDGRAYGQIRNDDRKTFWRTP